jgi:hypothetical protein
MSMIVNPFWFAATGPTPAVVGQALLYTGTGVARSVTGADFSPDLVIVKRRTPNASNSSWAWDDNVRGVNKYLLSDAAFAENTGGSVTSFDANGFSVGTTTLHNNSGDPFLALVLQRVAGAFDIVTYTGTGVAHAENHGLGVVPELIIVKNRTSASLDWFVYPGPLSSPETKFLRLNVTGGSGTSGTAWNNTLPTSTQFTVGTAVQVNINAGLHVAYLFASDGSGCDVGSYVGDGNTNGPVVTTGFRPKFVLIKRTDAADNWIIFDDQRDATSPHDTYGHVNRGGTAIVDNVTTNTAGGLDFQATGFQSIDSAGTNCAINVNGATYIYLAIA